MQKKLCDVRKCLATLAAGVLSGLDRKKKLETAWVVVRGSIARLADFFLESAFSSWHDALACLLLRARIRRRKVEKCANGACFRVKMCSLSNADFMELMGEEKQKRQYCMWGTVFLPTANEGKTVDEMDCEDSLENYPRLHQTPVFVVPTSMEGNVKAGPPLRLF